MPKLVCKASEVLEDWFVIERAEHDGSRTLVPGKSDSVPHYILQYAGRISDADVEGTGAEMLELAEAIERRSGYGAKRCAVEVDTEHNEVKLSSPRNSSYSGVISLDEADDLVKSIRQVVRTVH